MCPVMCRFSRAILGHSGCGSPQSPSVGPGEHQSHVDKGLAWGKGIEPSENGEKSMGLHYLVLGARRGGKDREVSLYH